MKRLLLLLLAFCGLSHAQYVMGTTNYDWVTPSQPAKGASYVDGATGLTVTRITNAASDASLWGMGTGYATWNPLSSNGAHLLFYGLQDASSGGGYQLYNATAPYAWVASVSVLQWWNSQDPEPRWDTSGSHPERLYYRKDKQLRYYDAVAATDNLARDFTADFPAYGAAYYIYNGEEGIPSADSRYWAFMIRNSASPYQTVAVFVYDMTLDEVVASKDVTGNDPNNVGMSPSGNYVYVAYQWTGGGGEFDGPHSYTRDFATNVKIASDIPHLSFGWTLQGHEVAVSLNPGTDYLQMVRLDNGQVYNLMAQGDIGWDGSLLHAYTVKTGWAFVSTYTNVGNASWAYNQLWAIELNEERTVSTTPTPRIWRVALLQNEIGTNYYYEQPNAQMDAAGGLRLWWGANWNTDQGPMDVYQVALPANWVNDLNGTTSTVVRVSGSRMVGSWQ